MHSSEENRVEDQYGRQRVLVINATPGQMVVFGLLAPVGLRGRKALPSFHELRSNLEAE